MKVFHFLNAKWGLEAITRRRLKISRISSLNDPFEFLSLDCREKEFRHSLMKSINDIDLKFGLICFSANNSNPVQWSHYADRHKGICLGFEVPKDALDEVEYVEERIMHHGDIDENAAKNLLHTKYSHWKYEEEYRSFIELEGREGDHYFSSFDHRLKLVSIAVGANSSVTRRQVSEALGDYKDKIDVYKARPAFRSFKIVKNQCESLWI